MGTTPPVATRGATLSASWSETATTPSVTTRGAPSLGALAAADAEEAFKTEAWWRRSRFEAEERDRAWDYVLRRHGKDVERNK
jgi:hypothetical protein